MSTSRQILVWAVALSAAATAAVGQEYCVACTEPSGLYRCIIEDARPGVAPSLQVVCISRIAKEGGHGQCAVKRGVTVFECDGIVKRISMAADAPAAQPPTAPATAVPNAAQPAPSSSSGTAAAVSTPPAAGPTPANEPPKTVAEMAKRAKADSDKSMEKAGAFLKKSFSCIASLFTKCSNDEQ